MSFSEKLRLLRKEKNLKQDELAKSLNISRQSISNYENGTRFPNDEKLLCKIAQFFDVSVDYLLDMTNIRTGSLYETSNLNINEKESKYPYEKNIALEDLFSVVDRLPAEKIVKITEAIKLFFI